MAQAAVHNYTTFDIYRTLHRTRPTWVSRSMQSSGAGNLSCPHFHSMIIATKRSNRVANCKCGTAGAVPDEKKRKTKQKSVDDAETTTKESRALTSTSSTRHERTACGRDFSNEHRKRTTSPATSGGVGGVATPPPPPSAGPERHTPAGLFTSALPLSQKKTIMINKCKPTSLKSVDYGQQRTSDRFRFVNKVVSTDRLTGACLPYA